MILGTLAYMSPEVYQDGKDSLSPASDIWAIGCICYELSCGRRLFETEEMLENYIRKGHFDKSHFAHLNYIKQKEPLIIHILEGCLAVDPNSRINVWTLLDRIGRGRPHL